MTSRPVGQEGHCFLVVCYIYVDSIEVLVYLIIDIKSNSFFLSRSAKASGINVQN